MEKDRGRESERESESERQSEREREMAREKDIYIYILNLRTVLFRPLWTHKRRTEE